MGLQEVQGEEDVHWGELKAGKDPTNDEVLEWSVSEVANGKKSCAPHDQQTEVLLQDALAKGNKSRTAFITIFARCTLLKDTSCAPRFFEVTNVIRFGHVQNGKIQAVTSEYDFLRSLGRWALGLLWEDSEGHEVCPSLSECSKVPPSRCAQHVSLASA